MKTVEIGTGSALHLAYLNQAATQRTFRAVLENMGPAPWDILPFADWMALIDRFTFAMKLGGQQGVKVMAHDRAVGEVSGIPELFDVLITQQKLSEKRRHFYAPDVLVGDGKLVVIQRRKHTLYAADGMVGVTTARWVRSIVRVVVKNLMERYFKGEVDYTLRESIGEDGSLVSRACIQEVVWRGKERYTSSFRSHTALIGENPSRLTVKGKFSIDAIHDLDGTITIDWAGGTEGLVSVIGYDDIGHKHLANGIIRFDDVMGVIANFAVSKVPNSKHYSPYSLISQNWKEERKSADEWVALISAAIEHDVAGGRVVIPFTEHKRDGVGVTTGLQHLTVVDLQGRDIPPSISTTMMTVKKHEEVRDRIFIKVISGSLYFLVSDDVVLIRDLYRRAALA